jgi:hypothetical protein
MSVTDLLWIIAGELGVIILVLIYSGAAAEQAKASLEKLENVSNELKI